MLAYKSTREVRRGNVVESCQRHRRHGHPGRDRRTSQPTWHGRVRPERTAARAIHRTHPNPQRRRDRVFVPASEKVLQGQRDLLVTSQGVRSNQLRFAPRRRVTTQPRTQSRTAKQPSECSWRRKRRSTNCDQNWRSPRKTLPVQARPRVAAHLDVTVIPAGTTRSESAATGAQRRRLQQGDIKKVVDYQTMLDEPFDVVMKQSGQTHPSV